MKLLQRRFNAEFNAKAYQDYSQLLTLESEKGHSYIKEQLGLKRKPSSSSFKSPDEENRIYPNTFAHVITSIKNQKLFSPMRYRVRPQGSKEEIPSKYNVFNARLDSLQSRSTWKSIFMKNHGLFPFKKFYEWVDYRENKALIHFSPKEIDLMYAPCLYDKWESPDKKFSFYSFAIITTDPNQEVLEAGHDRSPIFLKEEYIDRWLSPQTETIEDIYQILRDNRKVYYENSLRA